MAVIIGSARADENKGAHGGKAGDQRNGLEVSTQNWYLHTKGWRVLRAKSPVVAEKMAQAMQAACDNDHIGYDQYQRDTLRLQAAKGDPIYWTGADVVTQDTETDCSALVRVCIAYAMGHDVIGDVLGTTRWSTGNMCKFMLKTGLFVEMEGSQYTEHPDYLRRGDVLCTKTQAHTVIVLSNGKKADTGSIVVDSYPILMRRDTGDDVAMLQKALLAWNATILPKYGADGDFGKETESAVKVFQKELGIEVDGIVGAGTWDKLEKYLESETFVVVSGGAVNVRESAGTEYDRVGIVHKGDKLSYTETTIVGTTVWYHIENGWISGKYASITD